MKAFAGEISVGIFVVSIPKFSIQPVLLRSNINAARDLVVLSFLPLQADYHRTKLISSLAPFWDEERKRNAETCVHAPLRSTSQSRRLFMSTSDISVGRASFLVRQPLPQVASCHERS